MYAPNKIPAQLIHLLADVDGQFGGLYGKDRGSSHYWLAQRNSTPSKGKVANLFSFSGLYLQCIHTCAYDQLIFGEEEAPHRSAQDPQSLKNHSDY